MRHYLAVFMTSIRRVAVTVVLAGLLMTSGCLGLVTGDQPTSFAASQATVSQNGLSNTGFQHVDTQSVPFNRTFTVAGQTRTVNVTNWLSIYDQSVNVSGVGTYQAAGFVVFSTPGVQLAGQSLNPIGHVSNEQLVTQLQSQLGSVNTGGYDVNVRNVHQVGAENVTMLGKRTKMSEFAATTTVNGQQVDVYLHVAKVKHDGDYVVAVGVYPQNLSSVEHQRVVTLANSVQH